MEQQLNEAEVWARVRAASARLPQTMTAAETNDDPFAQMLQQANQITDTYRRLLQQTRGEPQRQLRQLWEDSCRQRRLLAAIAYVTTGSAALPPAASVLPMLPVQALLRQLCSLTVRQAEAYSRAAENSPFAQQFHSLHAATCRTIPLLLSMLGRYL